MQTVKSDAQPTITYKYDPAGRILSQTAGSDSGELVTESYTYDIYGNVKTATDAMGNVTSCSYDGNGNLTETTDAAGRIFYSRYDALNRVTETGMRSPSEPGKDIVLTKTAYNITAHTVTETDAVNGGSITTTYDTAGRPVKTTDGEGAVLSETIYDTEGRILQTVDAMGCVTENVYDTLGQLKEVRAGAKARPEAGAEGTYEP